MTEDIVEEARLLVDVAITGDAPLEQPSAAEEGDYRHESDQTPTLLHIFLHSCRITATLIRKP